MRIDESHWTINDPFFFGALIFSLLGIGFAALLIVTDQWEEVGQSAIYASAVACGGVFFLCVLSGYTITGPDSLQLAISRPTPSATSAAFVRLHLRQKGRFFLSDVTAPGVVPQETNSNIVIISGSPLLTNLDIQAEARWGQSVWARFDDGDEVKAVTIENIPELQAKIIVVPNVRGRSRNELVLHREALVPGETVGAPSYGGLGFVSGTAIAVKQEQGVSQADLYLPIRGSDIGGGLFDAAGELIGLTVRAEPTTGSVHAVLFGPDRVMR